MEIKKILDSFSFIINYFSTLNVILILLRKVMTCLNKHKK